MQYLSKPTKLEGIVHLIHHLDAVGFFDKPVLVVPKAIRTQSHLINKKNRFERMCNFGDPGRWYLKKRLHMVPDDHAGMHLFGDGVGNF